MSLCLLWPDEIDKYCFNPSLRAVWGIFFVNMFWVYEFQKTSFCNSPSSSGHYLGGSTLAGWCSCLQVTGAFEHSWLHEVADNAPIVFATSFCPDGSTSSGQ